MSDITFSTGVVEMSVNGIRNIKFNPSDVGFADMLFSLASKIEDIDKTRQEKTEKSTDPAKTFDYFRTSDRKMREAVDAVFGENFCDDVFNGVRLTALVDGMTAIENFIFAVVDKMDADITDNMSKRDARIAKYTDKYNNRKKV